MVKNGLLGPSAGSWHTALLQIPTSARLSLPAFGCVPGIPLFPFRPRTSEACFLGGQMLHVFFFFVFSSFSSRRPSLLPLLNCQSCSRGSPGRHGVARPASKGVPRTWVVVRYAADWASAPCLNVLPQFNDSSFILIFPRVSLFSPQANPGPFLFPSGFTLLFMERVSIHGAWSFHHEDSNAC